MNIFPIRHFNALPFSARSVVVFSEAAHYWSIFRDLADCLSARTGRKTVFLCSDEDDPAFSHDSVSAFYIGTGWRRSWFMSFMKARCVVMTTPHLQIKDIKRSPGVAHYAHIMHAPVDVHWYRPHAFDAFDSVLCSGAHQIKSLRTLERIRKSRAKMLFETGYTHLDFLAGLKTREPDPGTVLFAPSWGQGGLLEQHGVQILNSALTSGRRVILRPHPQSWRHNPKLLRKLKEQFADNENLEWDSEPHNAKAMQRAEMLITDFSGIAFDFAFLHKRGVLSIDASLPLDGYEGNFIDHPPWEEKARNAIGLSIRMQDYTPEMLETVSARQNDSTLKRDIDQLMSRALFNAGKAAETAARQLLTVASDIVPPDHVSPDQSIED